MLVTATWKIELGDPMAGGALLLDFTDLMEDEPSIDRSQTNDIAAALGSAGRVIYPRGNVLNVLSFTRVKVFDHDAEARAFMLAHVAAITDDVLDCTITKGSYVGAPTATLQNAVIDQDAFESHCEANRFIANYRLMGGALV